MILRLIASELKTQTSHNDNQMRNAYYTLNSALRYKSRTRPFAFIIAHECEELYRDKQNNIMTRKRLFYAFDDVEHFLRNRQSFPHSHEVVYNRFTDKQQGRLVFDFDFDEPWAGLKPNFVCHDFEDLVEKYIVKTFETYYVDVDVSLFEFIWLVSDVTDKWSKHLIVKNAFFADDWKVQSQVFYHLLMAIVEEEQPFRGLKTDNFIDYQVARNNATMRMLGCSKINKDKILELDPRTRHDVNFYDTLIQLHRRKDIQSEQHIYSNQLQKKYLDELFHEKEVEMIRNPFYKVACDLCHIDLTKKRYKSFEATEKEIQQAFRSFECYHKLALNSEQPFFLKSVLGSLINLERRRPERCLLSGKVHDNENAYLTISPDKSVYYHCRRGCDFKGQKAMCIRKSPTCDVKDQTFVIATQ